jgi:hypothetical protein
MYFPSNEKYVVYGLNKLTTQALPIPHIMLLGTLSFSLCRISVYYTRQNARSQMLSYWLQ